MGMVTDGEHAEYDEQQGGQSSDGDETFAGCSGLDDDCLQEDIEDMERMLHEMSKENKNLHDKESSLISNIPDECLSLIFRKLDQSDLARCSLVCHWWWSVDAYSRSHVILRAVKELSPALPSLLSRFCGISKLVLRGERGALSLDDKGLLIVGQNCQQLRKLKLKSCKQISDEGLEAFSLACPELLKFSCGSCGFGAVGLNALLENCTQLEDLTVKRNLKTGILSNANPEPLSHGCGKLRRLCLKDQSSIQLWTKVITESTHMETLILARNSGNWDDVLHAAFSGGRFKELSQMYLERLQISNRALEAIASCHALEALVVVRAPECTNEGLTRVTRGCRGIRRLHVEGWGSPISDAGLRAIVTNCTNLQELVMVGHSVTVSSIQLLANQSPLLERLTLCGSEVLGDSEVQCLTGGCPSLRRLCIKSCRAVTDNAVLSLVKGCPALRKLKVRRCPEITMSSIQILQKHRPEVQIQLERRPHSMGGGRGVGGRAGGGGGEEEESTAGTLGGVVMEAEEIDEVREGGNVGRGGGGSRGLTFSRARNAFAAGTSFVTGTFRRLVGTERRRDRRGEEEEVGEVEVGETQSWYRAERERRRERRQRERHGLWVSNVMGTGVFLGNVGAAPRREREM